MSEPESKIIENTKDTPRTAVPVAEDLGSAGKPSGKTRSSGTASRSFSWGIAWLAFLLVLALAGGTAWVVREAQFREVALSQRVADLESTASQKQSNLEALSGRLQTELNTGLAGLKTELGKQSASVSRRLDAVETQLAAQQKELARFSASDRESWLLAETGHLLRLANQRLVMAGDPVAAQALLNSADSVLRELDDPNLHAVRAAVARDVAALRAVPKVDVEGIYLRLAALIEQADRLVIFQFPAQAAAPAPEAAEDWRGRLRQGYQAALSKLSDYIIIRRRDVPMQALMDPQWEGLVRQNLRMLLEQAQVALLSGNQALYVASLEQAQQWVLQFKDSDTAAADAILTQVKQLASLTIQIPQPNISRSQHALDAAIEQRAQAGGGE